MNKIKKLKLNTITSLLNQLVTIICGFILPKYILIYYGSEVNGLISSITQFLAFISFCEMGVGAVVQSSLYKPLAKKNNNDISSIVVSANRFFSKIAFILVVYVFILMIFLPLKTQNSYSYSGTCFLILSMSISLFAQYYFGITNQLLLNSDQRAYVHIGVQIFTVVINTIASVILISIGMSIQVVKICTAIIYLIKPLYLMYYVKRNYMIDFNMKVVGEPIKQKWNGLAQHIAAVVLKSTDVIVLTMFSTLENVSIYTVYFMVVNGIKLIVMSLTTGIQSLLGNILVTEDEERVNNYFGHIEWVLHTTVIYLFTMTGILISPFIKIYTQGIADVSYYAPIFAILMTSAQAAYCLRLPYNMVVLAAGHYKQTQFSAFLEVIINIVISIALVIKWGVVGVAIGTLLAMIFRTIYFVIYLSRNIINRPLSYFLKSIGVNLISVILMVLSSRLFSDEVNNYFSWIIYALKLGITFGIIVVAINTVFYKNQIKLLANKIIKDRN